MDLEEIKHKHTEGEFILRSEFRKHDAERSSMLLRFERYAGWTLPILFPRDELDMEDDEMQNDFQSVGASCTTNLANKIMMALFQPSKPFFRIELSGKQRNKVESESGLSGSDIDAALAKVEREAMKELTKINARVVLTDVVQALIVLGNSLLFMPKDKKVTAFSIRDYVVKRDLYGEFVRIITRETKSVSGLPEDLQGLAMANGYSLDDEVSIYTGIFREGEDKYIVWQELEDICECNKKTGLYNTDTLPWIPLTWNLKRGDDYGTGHVETQAGDFHTMSTLAEAILDYTTVITDVKTLVAPAGQTDVRELTEAASGAYVTGNEADLFVHTASGSLGNATDFLDRRFSAVERRIGAAFLLNSAVTRDAERVTKAEIQLQAHELESSLGGVYSRLATDLQLPLAKRLLRKNNDAFKDVEPVIVTGFESLSRNSDLENMRSFIADLASMADLPEQVAMRLKFEDVIASFGAGHGVDYEKIIKDEDTVKKEQKVRMEANAKAEGMTAEAQTRGQQQGKQ